MIICSARRGSGARTRTFAALLVALLTRIKEIECGKLEANLCRLQEQLYDPSVECIECDRRVGDKKVGCNKCAVVREDSVDAPRCQGGVDCGAVGDRPCARFGCHNKVCEWHAGLCLDCAVAGSENEEQEASGRVAQAVFNEVNRAGSSKWLSYVPGRGVDRHRPGPGTRLPAGKWIRWTMPYTPIGVEATERSKLGLWFNTEPVTHEVLTRQAGNAFPTDPFGTDIYIVQGEEVKAERDPESGRVR